MVVEREVNRTNQTTPGSGGRSLFKKSLTEPTLLEMSGYPTNQELAASAGADRWCKAIYQQLAEPVRFKYLNRGRFPVGLHNSS